MIIVGINSNNLNRNLKTIFIKTINNNSKTVCENLLQFIKTIYKQFIKTIKTIKTINRNFKHIKTIKKTFVFYC